MSAPNMKVTICSVSPVSLKSPSQTCSRPGDVRRRMCTQDLEKLSQVSRLTTRGCLAPSSSSGWFPWWDSPVSHRKFQPQGWCQYVRMWLEFVLCSDVRPGSHSCGRGSKIWDCDACATKSTRTDASVTPRYYRSRNIAQPTITMAHKDTRGRTSGH